MGFTPLKGPPGDDEQLCEQCYKPIPKTAEVVVVLNRKGTTSHYCSKFCRMVHRDQVTKNEIFKILYHDEK